MFDYRTCAMIVLSMIIAAPALVFADLQRSQQSGNPDLRLNKYPLASFRASDLAAPESVSLQVAVRLPPGRINGSDFPMRGLDQFAQQERLAASPNPPANKSRSLLRTTGD
jgi:hypothetical protein